MSFFENELFPTPLKVINQMLAPYLSQIREYGPYLNGKPTTILEPHGGTGAILDVLTKYVERRQRNLFTIEINPELRLLLQGKGYKVIGTDFLTYDEPILFDLILMNPPFSDGVKHVLKGWEVLNYKGRMTALLNAETIRNPHTKERANLLHLLAQGIDLCYDQGDELEPLLKALEEAGTITWMGQCFKEADRRTDVEVVMLRFTKPEKPSSFEFDTDKFDKDAPLDDKAYAENPLAHADALKNLVARYKTVCDIVVQRHELQKKLYFYFDGIVEPVYESVDRDASLMVKPSLEDQIAVIKSRFWNTVFQRTKIGSKLTSGYRKKFDEIIRHQAAIAFNGANIQELLLGFFANRGDIMLECIADVFDDATKYHKDNKIHNEGWKTNKGHRLGKRIIMPYGVSFSNDSFNTYHTDHDFLNDLDRVMCYLSGCEFKNIMTISDALDKAVREYNWQRPFESSFFKFRFYKKGTLHLDFLDLELLEDFNVMAAQHKKWLPFDCGYKTRRERRAEPVPEPTPPPAADGQLSLNELLPVDGSRSRLALALNPGR